MRNQNDQVLLLLFLGGLIVRLAVFLTASPFNPDQHWQVIEWILQHHGALPASGVLGQSYHPPLYYLLMAPIAAIGGPGLVHFASLLFSCVNLWLICRLVQNPLLFPARAVARIALAFACFLPQYAMYGNFISNDTLVILIGTLLFAQLVAYVSAPSMSRLVGLSLICGLGLLTKGTFLLSGFALMPLVAIVEHRKDRPPVAAVAMFCAVWVIIGSYKYVENTIRIGRPIVHNLDGDPEWARPQKGVWKGAATIFDVNVVKLIRRPILDYRKPTVSYPLLMYATFWYPYIPDSSFRGNVNGYAWTGSTIYAAAIVPTAMFVLGIARAVTSLRPPRRDVLQIASLLLLLANSAVVIAAGIRYDVWSCFQSRLVFASMMPMLVLFAAGFSMVSARRAIRAVALAMCWIAVGCCVLYFVIEVSLAQGIIQAGVPSFLLSAGNHFTKLIERKQSFDPRL